MYLLYTHNKKIETEQKKFVINSLMNSFPQSKFFCINDKIYAKNKNDVDRLKEKIINCFGITDKSVESQKMIYNKII